jgi:hypothetical protein
VEQKAMKKNVSDPQENRTCSVRPFLWLVFISCVCVGLGISTHKAHFVSDENNYWSATQSLVHDRDLLFDGRDLQRAHVNEFARWPAGLQLTRKGLNSPWYYSKPVAYSLALMPLTALLGTKGIYLTNALLLFACIYLGYRHLRHRLGEGLALFVSTGFYVLGLPFAFIFLIHAELWDMFLCALAAFLIIHPMSEETLERWRQRFPWGQRVFPVFRNDGRLVIASLLISLILYNKYPNAFMFVPLLFSFLLKQRRLRMALILLAASILPCFLFLLLEHSHSGHFSPKGGDRQSFEKNYPGSPQYKPRALNPYTLGSMKSTVVQLSLRFNEFRELGFMNFVYFFFGRYSGMVWYHFTAFLILLFSLIGWRSRYSSFLLVVLFGTLLIWMVTFGRFYFGQVGTVGNRYFLPMTPLILYLFPNLTRGRSFIFTLIAFTVSGIFMSSILINPLYAFHYPDSHTRNAPPFLWAPIELTQYRTLFKSTVVNGPGYQLSLHDKFAVFDKNSTGFRLTGKGVATAIVRHASPIKSMAFAVYNPGPKNNRVTIKVANQERSKILPPGTADYMTFSGFRQKAYMEKAYGRLSHVHITEIRARCSETYIPVLDIGGSSDPQPLGLFVKLPNIVHETPEATPAKISGGISVRIYPAKENTNALISGWSLESRFFWINGGNASLLLPPVKRTGDYTLTIKGQPYGPVVPLTLQVSCAGAPVGTLLFDQPGVSRRSCLIPQKYLPVNDSKPLEIQFTCDKSARPFDASGGKSTDKRQLSLAVHQILIHPEP